MMDHITLGKEGEAIAKKYLIRKGFKVLHTNWKHEDDEVDIIGMDGEELVFVEVKTRSTDYYGYPEEDVNKQKERYLIRAAEAYIEKHNLDVDSRFDIVSVILNHVKREIFHIEDAFYPT
jgi:putative endonuclease